MAAMQVLFFNTSRHANTQAIRDLASLVKCKKSGHKRVEVLHVRVASEGSEHAFLNHMLCTGGQGAGNILRQFFQALPLFDAGNIYLGSVTKKRQVSGIIMVNYGMANIGCSMVSSFFLA